MSLKVDFKNFIMRGNVLDLAVAVVIGAAFGQIITSFVNDVLMPPIGVLLGGIDFSEFMIVLQEATRETAAVTINYGVFIQTIVNFLIVAAAIFFVIKMFERARKKEDMKPAPVAAMPPQEMLLTEIRDLLKKK